MWIWKVMQHIRNPPSNRFYRVELFIRKDPLGCHMGVFNEETLQRAWSWGGFHNEKAGLPCVACGESPRAAWRKRKGTRGEHCPAAQHPPRWGWNPHLNWGIRKLLGRSLDFPRLATQVTDSTSCRRRFWLQEASNSKRRLLLQEESPFLQWTLRAEAGKTSRLVTAPVNSRFLANTGSSNVLCFKPKGAKRRNDAATTWHQVTGNSHSSRSCSGNARSARQGTSAGGQSVCILRLASRTSIRPLEHEFTSSARARVLWTPTQHTVWETLLKRDSWLQHIQHMEMFPLCTNGDYTLNAPEKGRQHYQFPLTPISIKGGGLIVYICFLKIG